MCSVGITYSELGRHQEAVIMEENALEVSRRVLPKNHPYIGLTLVCGFYFHFSSSLTPYAPAMVMTNLAITYSHLGRHQDALLMRETMLQFHRRVLPENHPDIGAT